MVGIGSSREYKEKLFANTRDIQLIIETIDSKANKTTALLMPPPQMTPGTPKFQPPVQSGDATPHGYQRSGGAVSQYTSVEVPAATGLVDVVTSDVKLNTLNKREQLLYWDDNFYGNSATKGREMLEALEAGKRHSPIFKNLDHLEKASWSITANPPGQNLADPGPMLEKSLERFASNGRFFWEWLAGPKDPSKEVYGLAQDYFRLLLHPGDGIFSAYHYGGFNALEEDLIRFSDVGFIGWQYVCEKEEMKLNGLRYFLYTSVGDWDFVELWETILEQEDIEPIEYPGHTFSVY